MDVLLTESQYKKLLFEEKKSEIEKEFDKSKNVTSNIISDIKKQYGIDFTLALTWGATIGGFVGPIQRYLETTYTNLSSSDITLICFGIILTFFSSNKEKLQKVLGLIKEKGIDAICKLSTIESLNHIEFIIWGEGSSYPSSYFNSYPNVKYMGDCELWYRLFTTLGYPSIVNDFKIVIGIGDHTLTHVLSSQRKQMLMTDVNYCKIKYNI
jgi:hypothetical protein